MALTVIISESSVWYYAGQICKEVGINGNICEVAIPHQTHFTHVGLFDFHNNLFPTDDQI